MLLLVKVKNSGQRNKALHRYASLCPMAAFSFGNYSTNYMKDSLVRNSPLACVALQIENDDDDNVAYIFLPRSFPENQLWLHVLADLP